MRPDSIVEVVRHLSPEGAEFTPTEREYFKIGSQHRVLSVERSLGQVMVLVWGPNGYTPLLLQEVRLIVE